MNQFSTVDKSKISSKTTPSRYSNLLWRLIIVAAFSIVNLFIAVTVGLAIGFGGGPDWIMYAIYSAAIIGPILTVMGMLKTGIGISILPIFALIIVFLLEILESVTS
ncbi:MAG TPA: hypothetical protein VJI96_02810 [Candidatus Andersenbacteria bacterium]|nr:hypothetical protein [Candidatus Andersenbacteria bacterium]